MNRAIDVRSEAPPKISRRKTQSEATKARLFDETVREFKRSGFAATEIVVVTERLGVSRGTFYVHFPDGIDPLQPA